MVYKASFLWRRLCASVRRFSTPVTKHKSTGRSVMSKDIASNKSRVTHTTSALGSELAVTQG